jgi:hypothetical protein
MGLACGTNGGKRNAYRILVRLMQSPCCLCVRVSHLMNFWMPELIFMRPGIYIMAPEPISMAYFFSPSDRSVCLYLYPLLVARCRLGKNPSIVAKQRLGKNITAATNTQATIEELLGASFLCGPCRIKESKRSVLPRSSCLFIKYHAKALISTLKLFSFSCFFKNCMESNFLNTPATTSFSRMIQFREKSLG